VWTPEEITDALGDRDGKMFCDYYGVTNAGNFDSGESILHVRVDTDVFANHYQLNVDELGLRLAQLRKKLLSIVPNGYAFSRRQDTDRMERFDDLSSGKGLPDYREERYLDAANRCAGSLGTK